jgi:hypothetical protein
MDLGLKPCRHHAQKSEKEDNLSIRKAMKKIKIALLGILVLFVTASLGWSATYYVDATSGKDTNTGLSQTTAWKTIAKVNASRFEPGDQILFKRGEGWRECLGAIGCGPQSDYPLINNVSGGYQE